MTDATFTPEALLAFDRGRLSQRHSTWTVAGAGAVTLGVLIGSLILDHRAPAPHAAAVVPGTARLGVPTDVSAAVRQPLLKGTAPQREAPMSVGALAAAFRTPDAKPLPDLADPDVPRPARALALASPAPVMVPPKTETAMLDPGFVRGPAPASLADSGPLASRLVAAPPASVARPAAVEVPAGVAAPASVETPAAVAAPAAVEAPAPAPATRIALGAPLPEAPHDVAPAPVPTPVPAPLPQVEAPQAGAVPLPAPRPAFRWAAPEQYRASRRVLARNTDTAPTPPPAAVPADNRSFLERFFGAPKPSTGPVLAYASPEDGIFGRSAAIPASPAYAHDHYTAVYDISAHTVYMPDGTKLEAHSGLGRMLDNPRHVAARNVGPTPPHVYDLTLRESLFHGVQALRLNPVGGGGVFGRNGLLAHTFMLGPNGDSNGCVSFRDYASFLRAYQNGQVKRLVVVTGLS